MVLCIWGFGTIEMFDFIKKLDFSNVEIYLKGFFREKTAVLYVTNGKYFRKRHCYDVRVIEYAFSIRGEEDRDEKN